MRRSLAKFRESEASNHTPSLADFTTTTPELKFSVHTGSYVGGDLDGGRGASTRRRACAHAREPGRVQWTSRRAYGIHQRAVGELMGGIGSKGGKPHGRMFPQLSRFGVNVAKKYF